MKVEQGKCCGELLHGDATQKDVDSETATYDVRDDLRNQLKRAIMNLTDEQAEYVLWRLQCLKQENDF
ncbi:MAG: hypothetical protein SOZ12_05735 [Anaerotignum sp.]|nr:hypothetical protein [Anaerotignum sp.]MDY3926809.1 hypothetical protein [Anaerotignum sp.]